MSELLRGATSECKLRGCQLNVVASEATLMNDTLQDYLERGEKAGVIDFALRIVRTPQGELDFYIHPAGRDGETADFTVYRGSVVRLTDGAGSPRRRGIAVPLVGS
jgi:hypothetical protein